MENVVRKVSVREWMFGIGNNIFVVVVEVSISCQSLIPISQQLHQRTIVRLSSNNILSVLCFVLTII